MKHLTFILIAFLIISSCKKDDYTYSGSYISNNVDISKIRLFTIDGEVTDQSKIIKFLSKKEELHFVKNYDSIIDIAGDIEIKYLSENKIQIVKNSNLETREVILSDGYFIYESPSISTQYNFSTLPFYDKVFKLKPIYSETIPISQATGFTSKTSYKHCYFVKGKEDIIEMPLISFLYTKYTNTQNHSQEAVWNINNEFNPKSISLLTSTDTLVIQEFNVTLIKQ